MVTTKLKIVFAQKFGGYGPTEVTRECAKYKIRDGALYVYPVGYHELKSAKFEVWPLANVQCIVVEPWANVDTDTVNVM